MNIIRIKLFLFEHVIKADDGTFEGSTAPMVDLDMHISKDLNIWEIKPEKLFTEAHFKEVYESEYTVTTTKKLRVILDAKYEKANLHKVMENQCQHLTMTQSNNLLKLLHKLEEIFDGTPGT